MQQPFCVNGNVSLKLHFKYIWYYVYLGLSKMAKSARHRLETKISLHVYCGVYSKPFIL